MYAVTRRLLNLTFFFFFNDTATTEIYTLSLHDALPICGSCTSSRTRRSFSGPRRRRRSNASGRSRAIGNRACGWMRSTRSEEHTSELQSHHDLVCRLLLEKKKKKKCTAQQPS